MATTLDQALLDDALPASSASCTLPASGTSNSFVHTASESYWDDLTTGDAKNLEHDVFLAEMKHMDAVTDDNSWSLRVGKGGNIYSFRGAFGESVAPQKNNHGAFVDEVWQQVAVKTMGNSAEYFVHQAGAYPSNPPTTAPFFSPNLAKHCANGECAFASWGQMSTPKTQKSRVLYYTRYRDCGAGVLEVTWMMHNANFKNADGSPGDTLDYLNVPWGGVRTSSLPDVWLASTSTAVGATLQAPLQTWAASAEYIPNLQDLGGYSTFAQADWVSPVPVGLTLQLRNAWSGNACREMERDNKPIAQCRLWPSLSITTGSTEELEFFACTEADGTCQDLEGSVQGTVKHWAVQGVWLWLFPHDTTGDWLDELNAKFRPGKYIYARRFYEGRSINGNMALSVVHGFTTPTATTTTVATAITTTTADRVSPVPVGLTLQLRNAWSGNACREMERDNKPIAQCRLWPSLSITTGSTEELEFFACTEADGTCQDLEGSVQGTVKHWAVAGVWLWLFPHDTTGDWLDELNAKFRPDKYIHARRINGNLPLIVVDDNLPTDATTSTETTDRLRFGTTPRDYTAWQVNRRGQGVSPGQSYYNRQYMISGLLAASDTKARGWTDDTVQELVAPPAAATDQAAEGRPVSLCKCADSTSFQAVLGAKAAAGIAETAPSCPTATTKKCTGRTSPKSGFDPLFAVTCGTTKYVGPDPYAAGFEESATDGKYRSSCSTTPSWKLLGYFNSGCTTLATATFVAACD